MTPEVISSHWQLHPWAPGERKLMVYVEVPRWLQMFARGLQHLAKVHLPHTIVPIPGEWLHVTMLVLPSNLGRGDVNRVDLKHLSAPVVMGVPAIRDESVVFELTPTEGLAAIRDSVASQLRLPVTGGFRPHMSVAYAEATAPVAALRGEIGLIPPIGPWLIDEISLVEVTQHREYGLDPSDSHVRHSIEPKHEPGPVGGWYEWTHLRRLGVGSRS
jgi:hypothetical protein